MRISTQTQGTRGPRHTSGVTLVELVIAVALLALVFSGVIYSYVQAADRAQWSGYGLAAQGVAIQQLERARAAALDPNGSVCEITNIAPTGSTNYGALLSIPVSGTNYVWATNYVGIRLITNSVNPVVTVYMVRVDTMWPLIRHGKTNYFTNTVACYYSQDY